MVCLKNKIEHMLFAAVALLSFASCASGPKMSLLQLTPNLIEDLGPENMEKVAYHLSKNVELVRRDYMLDSAVRFQAGEAYRTDRDVQEVILVESQIQGAATASVYMQVNFVNYQVLGIEFEDETDTKLGFAVDLRDREGRYELQFDDDKTKTILYGNNDYSAQYKGDERPYLMVKVARDLVRDVQRRKAQGKKFE